MKASGTLERPVSCTFSVTRLAGDVKESTHLSKRVVDVVSGVVVYVWFHQLFHFFFVIFLFLICCLFHLDLYTVY